MSCEDSSQAALQYREKEENQLVIIAWDEWYVAILQRRRLGDCLAGRHISCILCADANAPFYEQQIGNAICCTRYPGSDSLTGPITSFCHKPFHIRVSLRVAAGPCDAKNSPS